MTYAQTGYRNGLERCLGITSSASLMAAGGVATILALGFSSIQGYRMVAMEIDPHSIDGGILLFSIITTITAGLTARLGYRSLKNELRTDW